jgi:2-polyprenyl-6-methoxyphenol hydroxylase-like FAD-dependent oxidoreductase
LPVIGRREEGSVRKVAIVGAGQAGLLAAHALRLKGYEVTLYSDKTPEDFLERARPTGVAARFDMAHSVAARM